MEQSQIDRAGFAARQLGIHTMLRGHSDHGFLLVGSSGPVRIEGLPWKRLVDRAFEKASHALEMKASALSDEDRRRFMSSASILCGGAEGSCPACVEKERLAILGIESLAQIGIK